MDTIHQVNIITHVTTGTIALLLGLMSLLSIKGGKIHNKSGRIFLLLISVVILTGLIGVFVFGRNTFLLVITVLSGYVSYSGFQVLKTKSNKPRIQDMAIAIFALAVLGYFLYYFQSIGMIWSPIVIYSTVGSLAVIIVYDFLKYLIPVENYKRKRIWLYEHIFKMVSAFSALLSAFSGTVLDAYQPHSQYLPSTVCMLVIIGFMIYAAKSGLIIWKKS